MEDDKEFFKLTLRLPLNMVEKIDEERKKSAWHVSRTQWITEAIHRALYKKGGDK